MAGRGKLIAVIGDEDTVTGFLLGGIGELNKNRHPNFLVVEKDTTINEIEDTFRYGSPRGLNGTLCCLVGALGEGGGGAGLPDPGRSVTISASRVREFGPPALPEQTPPHPKFPLRARWDRGGVRSTSSPLT